MPEKSKDDAVRVFIGLGSNCGDLLSNLSRAVELLKERAGELKNCSSVYRTAPWGRTDQDHFLNMVAEFVTRLSPWQLIRTTRGIEEEMQRNPKEHWGPRNIDLDIIYYGDKVILQDDLIIPHPYMYFRNFVLVPLVEIAPGAIHPIKKQNSQELLAHCDDTSSVIRIGKLRELMKNGLDE